MHAMGLIVLCLEALRTHTEACGQVSSNCAVTVGSPPERTAILAGKLSPPWVERLPQLAARVSIVPHRSCALIA